MAMDDTQMTPDVVEDVFDGHATGIEVEDPGGDTPGSNGRGTQTRSG